MTTPAQHFTEKAALVSARVHTAADTQEALDQTLALLRAKPPLEPQMDPGPGFDSQVKILAAPNLAPDDYLYLTRACETSKDIHLTQEGIRGFPAGIDMGVTLADFGIAETGTLVINSDAEETRLATMLCETHVAFLKTERICETALSAAEKLETMVKKGGSYTAFITGASRTADIERVLAIGVHGPLELHIMLIGG